MSNTYRWLVVIAVSALMGLAISALLPPAAVQWASTLYREKRAVLTAEERPGRILVTGGSGTHFGVDAQLIEDELRRPVLNLGIHAGLGLTLPTKMYRDLMRSGDTLLLIPEYPVLADRHATGAESSGFRAHNRTCLIRGPTLEERAFGLVTLTSPGLVGTMRGLLLNVFGYRGAAPYSTALDDRGAPLELPKSPPQVRRGSPPALPSKVVMQQLQETRSWAASHGVRFLIALPYTQVDERDETRMDLARRCRTRLETVVPVLADERTLNLSDDPTDFGDTGYHLTQSGRERRSRQLAEQLRGVLGSSEP